MYKNKPRLHQIETEEEEEQRSLKSMFPDYWAEFKDIGTIDGSEIQPESTEDTTLPAHILPSPLPFVLGEADMHQICAIHHHTLRCHIWASGKKNFVACKPIDPFLYTGENAEEYPPSLSDFVGIVKLCHSAGVPSAMCCLLEILSHAHAFQRHNS